MNRGIVGDWMPQALDKFDFQIIVESSDVDETTDYWQKQCSVLYSEFNNNLISGSIEPLASECESGEKADICMLLNVLIASSITKIALERILDVIDTWLENRSSAKVVLKFDDGSTIELPHQTKEEAFKLMEEHQRRIKV